MGEMAKYRMEQEEMNDVEFLQELRLYNIKGNCKICSKETQLRGGYCKKCFYRIPLKKSKVTIK